MEIELNKDNAIDLSVNSQFINGKYYSHIAVNPPPTTEKRANVAIICVLDISGSMDTEATQGQTTESDGFSRLDLVKHSVNTVIQCLEDGDLLAIVTFSDNARTDLVLTQMNHVGKQAARQTVKKMKTQGSTNLWAGIRDGLQLSKSQLCESKNTFVVVLTDGEPNVHPVQGNLGALKKYIGQHPLNCCFSIFGYGYALDTPLLSSMTQLGAGVYGYIPDCSMVGTIFVNFLSLALSTFSTLLSVQLETKKGKLLSLNGSSNSKSLLGPMQYGLTRNILIQHEQVNDNQEYALLHLSYGKNLRLTVDLPLKATQCGDDKILKTQVCRYDYINFLNNATEKANKNQLPQALAQCKQIVEIMKSTYKETGDPYLDAMIKDIQSEQDQQGQVSKALQNADWWKKWGKHYFPALKIAHSVQVSTNFKDPGLQSYSGNLFKTIESTIDTIFIKLPPPEPTIKKYDAKGNIHHINNMANYYNQYGGCIAGQCLVQLSNGQIKKVESLKYGDRVQTLNGSSKIKCVLITQVNKQIQMVQFQNGLIITNYHPIIYNQSWVFPIDVKPAKKMFVEKYYNFVLENGHTMIVNGIHCVTLGHGFKGKVIEHQYLGTEAVIKDLSRISGWEQGLVSIKSEMIKRDPLSKLIIGIQQ